MYRNGCKLKMDTTYVQPYLPTCREQDQQTETVQPKQLGLLTITLKRLIDVSSKMPLKNKMILYKTIIKLIWSYGIELWGNAVKSNLEMETNASQFITNSTTDSDFQIPTIQKQIESITGTISKGSKSIRIL